MAGPTCLGLLEHRDGGDNLTGCAVAALKGVMLDERLLHRVQDAAYRQALGRDDFCSVMRHGQREAAVDALAVEQDGAGAALAMVAALLRAVDTETFPQGV